MYLIGTICSIDSMYLIGTICSIESVLLEGYPHRLFAIRVGKLSILCVIWWQCVLIGCAETLKCRDHTLSAKQQCAHVYN